MPRASRKSPKTSEPLVAAGAVPAADLQSPFPPIQLPIRPPFPPQEARSVAAVPAGAGWLYEHKWDGFRCLAFRKDDEVLLQSKAGQPLGRYFPELVAALRALPEPQFVLDGEIVIYSGQHLSFDDLLLRIHPAASRIQKLSAETPATLLCFDLLVDASGASLASLPFSQRREMLERFFAPHSGLPRMQLSPITGNRAAAETWMAELSVIGFDGVIAKRADAPYASGERTAMVKVKRLRTADCVVGGFRYSEKGGAIGSLLLGLFNEEGLLDHVGFTSSFNAVQRAALTSVVEPLVGAPGFTGHAPGGPSRWSSERSAAWKPLRTRLVCEVQYDHFSGGRFRHGTKFLRWRPEKRPEQCTFEQVTPSRRHSPAETLPS